MISTARMSAVLLILLAAAPRAEGGAGAGSGRPRSQAGSSRSKSTAPAVHAALAAGRPRQALTLLNSRTLELPDEERCSLEGRAHFMLGDYAAARRKLESAVHARPKQASDLYWLGRAYEAGGSPGLAAIRFEQARWNGMETADLHHYWAKTLKASGRLLGEITQHDPRSNDEKEARPGTFAYGGLVVGSVPSRPGRLIVSPENSAIYQVHRALMLEPLRGDSQLLCAEIWAAVDRHKQAVAAYEKAAKGLVSVEELGRCHGGWAWSLLELGDFDGYLEHTRRQLSLAGAMDSRTLSRCYANVAQAVSRRGELQRQIRYLMMSVELYPDIGRLIELADALICAQRLDEAARYLEIALEQRPTRSQRREIRSRLSQTSRIALHTLNR